MWWIPFLVFGAGLVFWGIGYLLISPACNPKLPDLLSDLADVFYRVFLVVGIALVCAATPLVWIYL